MVNLFVLSNITYMGSHIYEVFYILYIGVFYILYIGGMLRKSGGFQKILRAFEIYSENTQYSRNPLKQLLFTYYMFLLTMDGQYTFLYYMFLYYMFTITMKKI